MTEPYKKAASSGLTGLGALMLACLSACDGGAGAPAASRSPALLDAVLASDTAEVRELIARGADVNGAEADGTTPLMRAAHAGDAEIAQALLDAGAAVAARNRFGVHALYLAVRRGDAATTRALLAAGADPNAALAEGETVLMTAARAGNLDVVRALLGGSAPDDALPAPSASAAYAPAALGTRRRGADPNGSEPWHGQTALMWAAAEGHAAIVQELLEAGANPDATTVPGDDALTAAAVDDATRAEAAGARGRLTALHFAARQNRAESVRALVEGGANPNAGDQLGNTPLHWAAARGSLDALEILAAGGASTGAQNSRGQTPLDVATAAAAPMLVRLQSRGS